jgi:ABC-2 type transport system ATP-binding protein
LIEFLDLGNVMDRLLRKASGGEKRRLSLAATLIHDPDLMFLDEPTAGVDPILRRKFWDHFEHLSDSGATMIVTTQYVGEAAYCDFVGVRAGSSRSTHLKGCAAVPLEVSNWTWSLPRRPITKT